MPSYVKSAPRTLIDWYDSKKILKGRALLERLVTHVDMEPAWRALSKHAKSSDYERRLFREIVFIEQASRKHSAKLRTDERDEYLRIAEQAEQLSKAIANGPLDKLLFEYFSSETMETNGIAGWENLDGITRVSLAHKSQPEWPPIVDMLDALGLQARKLAKDAMSKFRLVDRAPRRTEDFRKLYFVRALATYIASEYDRPLHSTVANITNAILDAGVIASDVAKLVKPTKGT